MIERRGEEKKKRIREKRKRKKEEGRRKGRGEKEEMDGGKGCNRVVERGFVNLHYS